MFGEKYLHIQFRFQLSVFSIFRIITVITDVTVKNCRKKLELFFWNLMVIVFKKNACYFLLLFCSFSDRNQFH